MSERRQHYGDAITEVYYEKKQSTHGYEHEKIGAWAAVQPGEDAEAARAHVKDWVERQPGESRRAGEPVQSCESLPAEYKTLEQAPAAMRNRYERARVFLEKIGLAVPTSWHDESDLPI